MSRFSAVALFLASLAATGNADGPSSQLRGSVAPPAAPEQGAAAGLLSVKQTDCGCSQGVCECIASKAVAEADPTEQHELEASLLNHTKALSAWWQEQGELARQLPCSCSLGAQSCSCGQPATNESSVGAGAQAGESSGLVQEALQNETEQSLSLWWAGGGGGWGRPGWGHRGWGHHGGFRCGRAGWGGCGCHYHGCHCGHAGFGGCGWR
jgi:hypothetical protein